jgi:hypothetical protein
MASLSPTATGTISSYTVSPALPSGLTLNASSGVISGTPTVMQPATSYTVTASNTGGSTSFALSILVNPAAPSGLSYTTPATVLVGAPMALLSPMVTGAVSSYSVSPSLPPGITIDSSSGVISGTPASASSQQTYTVTGTNVTGSTTATLQLTALALTANVGSGQTVQLGSFVTLDGTASSTSSGNALDYAWAFTTTPAGSESALAATSSLKPVFRADRLGTYTVALTLTDGGILSRPATVDVTVVPKVARTINPPVSGSVPIGSCRDIATPGNYRLTADLVAAPGNPWCLSIHDTSDVVLHCDGHGVSDAPDYSARGISIRNVQRFTIRACRITTGTMEITDSSDGHMLDNQIEALPGLSNQSSVWVWRTPRFAFDFNNVANIALQLIASADATVTDNRFTLTVGHASQPGVHLNSLYGANVQILRNEFDGGWDGIALYPNVQNTLDDAIVLKDAVNARVRHNYMKNYWDAGIEWTGRLENSLIEANVIVNAGFGAIGGWYWSSVSNTQFLQNLADRSRDLIHVYRSYGLRPANFDSNGGTLPADTGIYFRNNVFDGNVQRNQRDTTLTGGDSGNSAWIPVYNRMFYSGSLSVIPGERVPTDAEYDFSNNLFIHNDFGHHRPGPAFGTTPVSGIVRDGGHNICVPIGANYPLACQ